MVRRGINDLASLVALLRIRCAASSAEIIQSDGVRRIRAFPLLRPKLDYGPTDPLIVPQVAKHSPARLESQFRRRTTPPRLEEGMSLCTCPPTGKGQDQLDHGTSIRCH